MALVCAAPGTVSAAPRDPIVADELLDGPPPAYSYVDTDTATLVTRDEGIRDLPDGWGGSRVYKARAGWLTTIPVERRDDSLVLMQPDGAERIVVHARPQITNVSVSIDGRLMAVRTGIGRLEVHRISDGSRLARLNLAQDVYPLAMSSGRVLVAREPTPARPNQYSLAWWDIAGGRVP